MAVKADSQSSPVVSRMHSSPSIGSRAAGGSFDDCDGAGVLSTVAGTIGILIANSALNVIIGNENYNEMLVLDLQHNIIQRIAIKNDDN